MCFIHALDLYLMCRPDLLLLVLVLDLMRRPDLLLLVLFAVLPPKNEGNVFLIVCCVIRLPAPSSAAFANQPSGVVDVSKFAISPSRPAAVPVSPRPPSNPFISNGIFIPFCGDVYDFSYERDDESDECDVSF